LKNVVAVSPDIGGVPRAFKFAERIKASLAILNKRRPDHSVAEVLNVIGEVEGKPAILIDDMIDTGGSISEGVKFLINQGAKEVYVTATHPIFSGNVVEKLMKVPIKEIVVTDTLPIPQAKRMNNLTVLSISKILKETIYNVYMDESVSEIFEGDNQI
jgi:ribose-phosphate pyrophosphokinase